MLRAVLVVFLLSIALVFNGCSNEDLKSENKASLVVGATPEPHALILEKIKPILEQQGIILEIREFTDYVTPNLSLDDGSLDANFFQHKPYLDSFNHEKGTTLVSIGGIHLEPMGVY
ncbi:MAG: methionine ABC transporter substrate-binding protein, partial [Helicobacter sp.]|nr:methionine ABC transporter substrate-binding protein [Helicobacter sp.]